MPWQSLGQVLKDHRPPFAAWVEVDGDLELVELGAAAEDAPIAPRGDGPDLSIEDLDLQTLLERMEGL